MTVASMRLLLQHLVPKWQARLQPWQVVPAQTKLLNRLQNLVPKRQARLQPWQLVPTKTLLPKRQARLQAPLRRLQAMMRSLVHTQP